MQLCGAGKGMVEGDFGLIPGATAVGWELTPAPGASCGGTLAATHPGSGICGSVGPPRHAVWLARYLADMDSCQGRWPLQGIIQSCSTGQQLSHGGAQAQDLHQSLQNPQSPWMCCPPPGACEASPSVSARREQSCRLWAIWLCLLPSLQVRCYFAGLCVISRREGFGKMEKRKCKFFSFIFISHSLTKSPFILAAEAAAHSRFGDRMLRSGSVCSRCKAWKIINTNFPEQGMSVIACTL